MLRAPNGLLIQFDDDLPEQGWQLSVNLEAPVPLDTSVFSNALYADVGLSGTSIEAGIRDRKIDLEDTHADTQADSWDYELLVILVLGVLAIVASRLRRRRRRRAGKQGPGGASAISSSSGPRTKVRVRKRVRLG